MKARVLQFFTAHPFLGFLGCLGSLASIMALPFAVFPSLVAPKRELSFCVNPVRTPIVQTAKSSDVSILYKGHRVAVDVTAVQVAVWNSGREPIKAPDCLSPVTLRIPDGVQLLDAKPLSISRSVLGFEMKPLLTAVLTNSSDPNSIPQFSDTSITLSWKILEHNDGALIQIVYVGDSSVPLSLQGTIVGQKQPYEVKSSNVARKEIAEFLKYPVTGVALFIIAAILTNVRIKSRVGLFGTRMVVVIGMVILLMCAFSALDSWGNRHSHTPFGF